MLPTLEKDQFCDQSQPAGGRPAYEGQDDPSCKTLARLREYLPDRKLETRHDVSTGQNIGFGEGNDVGG
jgi:hypothetical protein